MAKSNGPPPLGISTGVSYSLTTGAGIIPESGPEFQPVMRTTCGPPTGPNPGAVVYFPTTFGFSADKSWNYHPPHQQVTPNPDEVEEGRHHERPRPLLRVVCLVEGLAHCDTR